MRTLCVFSFILLTVLCVAISIQHGNPDAIYGFITGAFIAGITSPIILFWKD